MMTKPITGTNEWSSSTVNFISGCSHRCHYCFAQAMAVRFGRCRAEEWGTEVIDEKAVAKDYGRRRGVVMTPSSHDITPATLPAAVTVFQKLLRAGNQVLIVSKPHLEVIDELCRQLRPWQGQVKFRFTIGSANSLTLGRWEPGAPALWERLESLRLAFESGYQTSVSVEPMLGNPDHLIVAVEPYVTDTIWLGRANQLMMRLAINAAPPEVIAAGKDLLEVQTDGWCREVYGRWKVHEKVRWKDSIKRLIGLHSQGKGTDT
jgi:hypothetical protein